jgi:Ricin-type beta-trefoil lectin domain-like
MRRSRICVLAAGTLLAAATGIASTAPAAAARISSHISRPVTASVTAVPHKAATADPFNVKNYLSTVINRAICLGISGGLDDNPAVVWTCNTHADQQWHFGAVYPPDPVYGQIVNGNNDCLGLSGGNTAEGTRVVAKDCTAVGLASSADQLWWVVNILCQGPTGGSYYPFQNAKATQAHSGTPFVAGTSGGGTANGTAVVIWKYQNSCNNQFWAPGTA